MARDRTYRHGEEAPGDDADPPRANRSRPAADRPDDDRPPPASPEAEFENALRPKRLSEVVGQRKVVERLGITLDAARRRGEPLGHLLLDGPPGLGKTTLATVVPRELATDGGNGDIMFTSGPALRAPHDLVAYLTNAARGSVLFIDENPPAPAGRRGIPLPRDGGLPRGHRDGGRGPPPGPSALSLNPFTVIGATTRSGMLTAPLRDRFVNHERVEYYDVPDLAEIVRRNAGEARRDGRRRRRGAARRAVPRHAAEGEQPAPVVPGLRPGAFGNRRPHPDPRREGAGDAGGRRPRAGGPGPPLPADDHRDLRRRPRSACPRSLTPSAFRRTRWRTRSNRISFAAA